MASLDLLIQQERVSGAMIIARLGPDSKVETGIFSCAFWRVAFRTGERAISRQHLQCPTYAADCLLAPFELGFPLREKGHQAFGCIFGLGDEGEHHGFPMEGIPEGAV